MSSKFDDVLKSLGLEDKNEIHIGDFVHVPTTLNNIGQVSEINGNFATVIRRGVQKTYPLDKLSKIAHG